MALKYKVAKLEDVPEAVRTLYRQEGDAFVLDAEGVVPKERLDEFRNNNITLQQQLDKLKNIDPVKYAELTALQRKIEEKELLDKGEVDKVVNLRVTEMKTTYEDQIKTLQDDLSGASAQLSTLMIDNAIKSVAIKQGVEPTAIDDIVLRARGVYIVEKGQAIPKANGNVLYGKDGVTPLTMDEWVTGLKKTAPHLFQGSRGSGAGGGRGQPGVDLSKMTPAQKITYGLNQMPGSSIPSELTP